MSGDSLLDMMITEHDVKTEKRAAQKKQAKRIVGDLERDRHAQRVAAAQEDMRQAEARSRERAQATQPELAGLREGMRFVMRGCAAEINGEWIVHRVDPGAAGDQSRRLYARRADGGPGFLPFTERKALDAIHAGLLVR